MYFRQMFLYSEISTRIAYQEHVIITFQTISFCKNPKKGPSDPHIITLNKQYLSNFCFLSTVDFIKNML